MNQGKQTIIDTWIGRLVKEVRDRSLEMQRVAKMSDDQLLASIVIMQCEQLEQAANAAAMEMNE